MDHDTLKLLTTCIGCILMSGLIVCLCVALFYVYKHARFRFITLLVSLMICSDAGLGILCVCFYFEHQAKSVHLLAISIGIFTFLFNFGILSLQWLFSMKYWMVAHEVPKIFEAGRDITFNEKIYKIIKVVGLMIIIPICIMTGYYRGRLS